MNRSQRNPDAYDAMRDDALTEQKPEWYVAPDALSAGMNAKLQEQAARIRELEAQLAAAEAKREQMIQRTTRQLGTLADTKQQLELQLAAATERERAARQLLIDAHEPDQGQQRTEWDERVDAWLAASDGQEGRDD